MAVKLFILGRPGSGKSEVAQYIRSIASILDSKRWFTSRNNDYGKSTASNLSKNKVQSRDSRNQKYKPDNDDKMRQFLAIWTAFLMLFALVGYLVTRDVGVLVATTFIGIAVKFVFGYYFKR